MFDVTKSRSKVCLSFSFVLDRFAGETVFGFESVLYMYPEHVFMISIHAIIGIRTSAYIYIYTRSCVVIPTISYHMMLYHVVQCNIISYDVISRYTILYYIVQTDVTMDVVLCRIYYVSLFL